MKAIEIIYNAQCSSYFQLSVDNKMFENPGVTTNVFQISSRGTL